VQAANKKKATQNCKVGVVITTTAIAYTILHHLWRCGYDLHLRGPPMIMSTAETRTEGCQRGTAFSYEESSFKARTK
jgi:hypothetical protein